MTIPSSTKESIENEVQESDTSLSVNVQGLSLKDATVYYQRQLIQHTLEQNHGVIAKAARQLQTDRGNFYRLAKKLGVI